MPEEKHDIYNAIYEVVRLIPRGRVSSYGAIAAAVGVRSGARMVGYALKSCSNAASEVPAHRVVNRNGALSGRHHFATPDTMQQLLEAEGVAVQEHSVVHFATLFWDPIKEL